MRPIATLALLAMLAGCGAQPSAEPAVVRVVSAANQQSLQRFFYVVSHRPGEKSASGWHEGGPLDTSRRPGSTIHVYAPDHAIYSGPIEMSDETIELTPSGRSFRLTLAEALRADVKVTAMTWVDFEGFARPVLASIDEIVFDSEQPKRISMPDGTIMKVISRHGEGKPLSPATIRAEPDREYEFALIASRDVQVFAKRDGKPTKVDRLFVTPDWDRVPRKTKQRTDSVLSWLVQGGVQPVPAASWHVIQSAPSMPFLYCAQIRDRWTVGRLTPTEGRHAVVARPRKAIVSATADGLPLPKGTFLFPGRFDIGSVGYFLNAGFADQGLGAEVGESSPLSLPPAGMLTAFHPVRGLAHLQWSPQGHAKGAWATGKVRIEVAHAPTGLLEGSVSLWRTLAGTGAMQAGPINTKAKLTRAVAGERGSVDLPGLPPGVYGVMYELTCSVEGEPAKRLADTAVAVVSRQGHTSIVRVKARAP